MKKILASQKWSAPQRKWLERIGKQLEKEYMVGRETLDKGAFKAQGGFQRINKVFQGRLERVLSEINRSLWEEDTG